METYILDTNVFFNMEADFNLGKKTEEVVKNISKLGRELKAKKLAKFIMPPRAVDEFLSFFEDKNQPFIKDFLSVIDIKSPQMEGIQFPASVFYRLVEDVRLRSYRGLTIAEEEMKNAASRFAGEKPEGKKDFEIRLGPVIKSFRQRFRNATRTGFLDSLADLDLIVLAKETSGFLITTDEGVTLWGRIFGVKEMRASAWRKRIEDLLEDSPHQE